MTVDNDDNTSEEEVKNVKQLGNNVFFYSDVSTASVQSLYEAVNEANKSAILRYCRPYMRDKRYFY